MGGRRRGRTSAVPPEGVGPTFDAPARRSRRSRAQHLGSRRWPTNASSPPTTSAARGRAPGRLGSPRVPAHRSSCCRARPARARGRSRGGSGSAPPRSAPRSSALNVVLYEAIARVSLGTVVHACSSSGRSRSRCSASAGASTRLLDRRCRRRLSSSLTGGPGGARRTRGPRWRWSPPPSPRFAWSTGAPAGDRSAGLDGLGARRSAITATPTLPLAVHHRLRPRVRTTSSAMVAARRPRRRAPVAIDGVRRRCGSSPDDARRPARLDPAIALIAGACWLRPSLGAWRCSASAWSARPRRQRRYSTVTVLARLRGWSTFSPRRRAIR